MPRIRMCDADLEKYGGPEWVEIETADLTSEAAGVIEQIEEVWGLSPYEFLNGWYRGTIKARRVGIWAARWKAGCKDNPDAFRPLTMPGSGVRYEPTTAEKKLAESAAAQEGEAGPPADGAAETAHTAPSGS